MTHFTTLHALAFANFLICTGIGWCCVCRLHRMTAPTTRRVVRAVFALLFGGATASGFSPVLFGEWPGAAHVLLAGAILAVLIAGAKDWRNGLPDYAKSAPVPLDFPHVDSSYGDRQ